MNPGALVEREGAPQEPTRPTRSPPGVFREAAKRLLGVHRGPSGRSPGAHQAPPPRSPGEGPSKSSPEVYRKPSSRELSRVPRSHLEPSGDRRRGLREPSGSPGALRVPSKVAGFRGEPGAGWGQGRERRAGRRARGPCHLQPGLAHHGNVLHAGGCQPASRVPMIALEGHSRNPQGTVREPFGSPRRAHRKPTGSRQPSGSSLGNPAGAYLCLRRASPDAGLRSTSFAITKPFSGVKRTHTRRVTHTRTDRHSDAQKRGHPPGAVKVERSRAPSAALIV